MRTSARAAAARFWGEGWPTTYDETVTCQYSCSLDCRTEALPPSTASADAARVAVNFMMMVYKNSDKDSNANALRQGLSTYTASALVFGQRQRRKQIAREAMDGNVSKVPQI